jgi:LemA protein
MNKLTLSIVILVGVVLLGFGIFYLYAASVRDNAVTKQETVDESWGNVQTEYQRRADLIINLVEVVKAAAKTETNILIGVTEARAGIPHYIDSIGNVIAQQREIMKSADSPAALQQTDVMMMNTVRGFRGFMSENYPDLKSIANYGSLQAQLEGTENRVNTARTRYNDAVKDFNSHIRGTFRRMGLSLVSDEADNFKTREMFEAKEGADEAPKVKF